MMFHEVLQSPVIDSISSELIMDDTEQILAYSQALFGIAPRFFQDT